MRMLDLSRDTELKSVYVYVTGEEGTRFAELLAPFEAAPSGPNAQAALFDNGDRPDAVAYRPRRIIVMKVNEDHPEAEGWPESVWAYLKGRAPLTPDVVESLKKLVNHKELPTSI